MKVAVIGAGIAGLGAAWALRDRAAVALFEKQERLGGQSHTVDASSTALPRPVAVDTGFIVYNLATYPNLIALFDRLQVKTQASDMSFAVSIGGGSYEYSGDRLTTLIGHWQNLLNIRHWRMLKDLVRFLKHGADLCNAPENQSLGAFLDQHGYSAAFRDLHLLPMAGAIWSASNEDILGFPARSFGLFFHNHGLLEIDTAKRPQWRTVSGGSRQYVDKLVTASRATVHLNARIATIQTGPRDAMLIFQDGSSARFDQVVIATHADEALAMLPDAAPALREALGAFRYAANTAYLHSDERLMPRRKALWASWNYLKPAMAAHDRVFVSYWINRLQALDPSTDFFVTLNPDQPPAAGLTFKSMIYHHPQFNRGTLQAQGAFRHVQGRDRLWFCGSYFGYGFHEDALASGLAVAAALGAGREWNVQDVSPAFDNATPVFAPALQTAHG